MANVHAQDVYDEIIANEVPLDEWPTSLAACVSAPLLAVGGASGTVRLVEYLAEPADEADRALERAAIAEATADEVSAVVLRSAATAEMHAHNVRALRFAASLGFTIHSSFWLAVPFAVDALRNKVAGPRKVAELHKVAHGGRQALLNFFELAFSPLAGFGPTCAFGDDKCSADDAPSSAP